MCAGFTSLRLFKCAADNPPPRDMDPDMEVVRRRLSEAEEAAIYAKKDENQVWIN